MKVIIIVVFSLLFYSCTGNISAGTLSGWDIVVFKTSTQKLELGIDSLYKANSNYIIPEKWESEAEKWIKNYSYLKTVVIYFDDSPEEMYYVTFIDAGTGDNPNYSRLAIRGVKQGNDYWKQFEEFNASEQERIEKRFEKEIVKKLEQITKTNSYIEKTYH
ncbi:hypothetical protein [Pedobacter frigoris]|uniref:Uncharacterized protein n=1 Tax=Pedobacter frigoris TaxID=2571272 RepID=A0A4U1CQC9_9SPHI|nr:hypothetical protein [Pedobacter frigoris]TKC09090.1 hypothetical protein FA047_03060 [Pedobacter frigoris]